MGCWKVVVDCCLQSRDFGLLSSPVALFDNNNGDIFIDQYTQYTCAYFDR